MRWFLIVLSLALVACTTPPAPTEEGEPQTQADGGPPGEAPAEAEREITDPDGPGTDADPDDADAETDETDEAADPPAEGRVGALVAPVRGVWVHLFDDSLKSRESIVALVAELEAAGADLVIAQVARRHDAYYRSDVLPATPDPTLEPGLDVIDVLTTEAHAAGIAVHAWISVAPTTHGVYDDLDAPPGWVATTRGLDAPEDQRWVTRSRDGTWSEYLDPALPEVRDHVAAVAGEIATRYPVDGIHLDYVRYESPEHGYHPDVLARYAEETGAQQVPEPDDDAWSTWRRDATRDLVAQTRAALPEDVDLSAAVIAWGGGPPVGDPDNFLLTRTATDALQDWPRWVREGLVDAVMPMTYFRESQPTQAVWLTQWLDFAAELGATEEALIIPGIAGYLNEPSDGLAQVAAAMAAGDGAIMYSYQQPTEDHSRQIWADLAERGWGAAPEG